MAKLVLGGKVEMHR